MTGSCPKGPSQQNIAYSSKPAAVSYVSNIEREESAQGELYHKDASPHNLLGMVSPGPSNCLEQVVPFTRWQQCTVSLTQSSTASICLYKETKQLVQVITIKRKHFFLTNQHDLLSKRTAVHFGPCQSDWEFHPVGTFCLLPPSSHHFKVSLECSTAWLAKVLVSVLLSFPVIV